MADVEYSDYVEGLTSAGTLDGTEIVGVSKAGSAVRTTSQAIANKASIPASQISDSTATGRSVLTAANAGAARTAIGAGTSDFDGDYDSLTNKPTLGTAAALNVAASGDAASGEVVKGNDTRLTDSRAPTSAGLAAAITGATSKSTPVDADELPIADSAASFGLKKLTWSNLKATLKTYFDTVYSTFDGAYSSLSGKPTLGTAAALDVGTSANNVVQLDGTGKLPAVDGSQLTGISGGSPAGSAGQFQYGDGSAFAAAPLWREDANTLAQRNGTSPQTFNIYNTYTDASNYERGFVRWSSNKLDIGTAAAGTGAGRSIKIGAGGLIEIATGGVTRAAFFGSTTQFSSDVAPWTDGSHDLGTASIRWRNIFAAGSLAMGVAAKSANYTVTINNGALTADCTSGAVTFTLPALSGTTAGEMHIFKKIDSSGNAMNVDASGSETIDGSTSAQTTSTQWGTVRVMVNADKSGWLTF